MVESYPCNSYITFIHRAIWPHKSAVELFFKAKLTLNPNVMTSRLPITININWTLLCWVHDDINTCLVKITWELIGLLQNGTGLLRVMRRKGKIISRNDSWTFVYELYIFSLIIIDSLEIVDNCYSIINETLIESKTPLELFCNERSNHLIFFQYTLVLISKRKCLVGASPICCRVSVLL